MNTRFLRLMTGNTTFLLKPRIAVKSASFMRNKSLYLLLNIALLFGSLQAVPIHSLAQNTFNQLPALTVNNGDCNNNHFLPDNICTDIEIVVSGIVGTSLQNDVYLREVRLIIQHDFPDDLDISLTSPSGQTVELSTDNGGAVQNYGTPYTTACSNYMTFISNAVAGTCNYTTIDEASPPFIGTYLPEGLLTSFNTGNPNGDWILELCDDQPADVGYFEFVELVFAPFNCVQPGPITATTLDSTSLHLDWVAGSSCGNTIIEYGLTGFTPGTGASAGTNGTVIASTCPPYSLSNLLPETTYDIYVREMCGLSNYSGNTCPFTVTTICSPSAATLFEDFNSQTICGTNCTDACVLTGLWYNVNTDRLDWLVNNGPTPSLSTGPTDDFSGGGNYAYMETSCVGATGGRAELYSHCIDVQANQGSCHLSFNYYMYGSSVNGIRLQATTNGINWLTLWQDFGSKGPEWLGANVDLSNNLSGTNFDGQTTQFRFTAQKISGSNGDVAIDNIAFHGSTLAGLASTTLYYDNDGDNYGDNSLTYLSCFTNTPPAYTLLGDDCDDNFPFVNPGMPETPCDGFDLNCNPNDEFLLAQSPEGQGVSVCAGETDTLFATAQYGGDLVWFDENIGGNILHTGDFYLPNPILNNTSNSILDTFYVEEQRPDGCYSAMRRLVVFEVYPQPETVDSYNLSYCIGDTIDLTIFPFIDQNNTNATISYHNSVPPSTNNEIVNPVFEVQNNQVVFVVATAMGGCYDAMPITINTSVAPIAQISGSHLMCASTTQDIEVQDVGSNAPPYSIVWSDGQGNTLNTSSSITINAPTTAGNTEAYTAILTNASGCADTTDIVITATSGLLPIAVSSSSVSSCGGDDGEISLDPSGGVAPFTYTWTGQSSGSDTDGGGTFEMEDLEQGAYHITITDSSGGNCTATVPLAVVNGPAAIVEVENVQSVTCTENNDGAIDLTIFGANPSILWSNDETTEDIDNLAPGTYSVTVTEGNCESVLNNFIIEEPDTLFLKPYSIRDASCHNTEDGAINAVVVGGTAPYDIVWSNGITNTLILSDLSAGTYIATVTDANGCEHISIPLSVNAPDSVQISLDTLENVTCFGLNNGLLEVSADGGTLPYQIIWNNGGNNPTQTNLPPGMYSVTATDLNGCSEAITDIIISQPDFLDIQLTNQNDPDCVGAIDGFISIMPEGGVPLYEFAWSNGSTDFAAFNLGAGNHSVTVTDANNCTRVETYTLNAATEIIATTTIQNAHCQGINDGEAAINIQQGNEPFTFLWSNGDTTQQVTDLAVGNYEVTIQDADDCMLTQEIEISEANPIAPNLSINTPNCHGEATGKLQVMPSNGLPPFTIEWDNGVQDDENPNLMAGYYGVEISGADGCMILMDSILLSEPTPIEFNVLGVDSIICQGTNTGAIDMSVVGGDAPYNYTWSNNGNNSEDLTGIVAGMYVLSVADQNNCTVNSAAIEVWEAPEVIVEIENFDGQDNCVTTEIDSLNLLISGGLQPYSIEWSHGPQTESIQNVVPGDYEVTVTDALGCAQIINDIKVREDYRPPIAYQLDTFSVSGDCYTSNNNNLLCIIIEGGAAPYNYLWDDATVGTTNDTEICHTFNNNNNSHSVVITDANGCTTEVDNVQMPNVSPLNLYIAGAEHVRCRYGTDGAINLQIIGGVSPYNYLWENALGDTIGTNQDLANLPAGDYSVTVTDNNDCEITWQNFIIIEPDSLLTVTTEMQAVKCFDGEDGAIELTSSGGDLPYTYLWNTNETTKDIEGLAPGFYSVTVTDANTCVRVVPSIEVTQPLTALEFVSMESTNITCFGAEDGMIDLTITGGTSPYFYDWNIATTDEDPDNLEPGTYNCLVNDSNNCIVQTTSITITEPSELIVDIDIYDAFFNEDNGSITVIPSGGTPDVTGNYTIEWSTGETGYTIENLEAGDYYATVTDANDCILTLTAEVETIVAVDEADYFENMSIFPNPTNDRSMLSFTLLATADVQLEVVNMQGQILEQKAIDNCRKMNYIVDLEGVTSGAYFVLIRIDGELIGRRRLVKL